MPTLLTGLSPCPNDTFMFHALLRGGVAVPGLRFEPWFADIEALNQRALGDDPLPITKLSLAALAEVVDRYAVLPAGAALGRGCGPLVVSRAGGPQLADFAARRVAIPGRLTTANLLLRSFAPVPGEVVELRFDQILAAVANGECDAGVIIHESRFTYAEQGLVAVADLGELWEQATGLPLPLGVIAARRDLDPAVVDAVANGLRASVAAARADAEPSRAFVAEFAQEMSTEVCASHIALYVNEFSEQLGEVGRAAIEMLLERGRAAGLLPAGRSPWC